MKTLAIFALIFYLTNGIAMQARVKEVALTAIAVLGLLLFVLHCVGVQLPVCLTS